MKLNIALAGNPNSGKSTLFNELTGSNQYVGNWPGVTVEQKTGQYKKDKEIHITDLPGIYSLSPYTLEEVISREYLLNEKPDVIIDIIDATNIERNLYLATQLKELGIPLVLALNKMDEVRKNKDKINVDLLEKALECTVVEISALRGENIDQLIDISVKEAKNKELSFPQIYSQEIEESISVVTEKVASIQGDQNERFLAIKLLENDEKILEEFNFSPKEKEIILELNDSLEEKFDDDVEGIIADQRYLFIESIIKKTVKKGRVGLTTSDKIDRIVTNRVLAIPIFVLVMAVVYYLAMEIVGGPVTDFVADDLLGETVPSMAHEFFDNLGVSAWLASLIADGIIGGVGAVIGFLPVIVALFFFIAILEDIGYMSRIAFILDRVLRRFGLSGKSFIPILMGTGCSVPGIMGTRTIENENDRRMTIMVCSFMPCGAKVDIITMFAAVMSGYWWYGPIWYFGGILAVIVTGVILKKTKPFYGEPAPFVMELPEYHLPNMKNILKVTWERAKAFLIKAGTIILLATVVIWFLQNISTSLEFVEWEEGTDSILEFVGKKIAFIFQPLGFGDWISTVATVTGLVAKEVVVGTFGVLSGIGGDVAPESAGLIPFIASNFTTVSIVSFMFFNQLTVPCFAAVGAMSEELGQKKWLYFAIAYQLIFSYTIAFMIYQFGIVLVEHAPFTLSTFVALLVLFLYLFLLFRPDPNKSKK